MLSLLPNEGATTDYVPTYIRRLIEMCCHADAAMRPSFSEIVNWLEQCAPAGYEEAVEDSDEVERKLKTTKSRRSTQPSWHPRTQL